MKYALVVLEDPNALNSKDLALWNFANSVQGAGVQDIGVEIINAGVYLCSLEHGLRGLNRLVSEAESRGFRSRTLFFEESPLWVIS